MSKPRFAGLVLLAVALALTAAVAAHRGPDTTRAPGDALLPAPQAQVNLDGEFTPMQLGELDPDTRQALRRDTEGLVQVYHPDGSVSMNLEGRFQTTAVARLGEDGRPEVTCVDSPEVGSAPALEVK